MRAEIREKIVKQALDEIEFARRHKLGRVKSWHKVENMYYGKKTTTEDTRANVDLSQMQSFIHSILSKIDEPLDFKFVKRKLSQLKRVQRLNSLKQYDAKRDYWDIKDIAGKKQGLLYGRAIYCYYADSIKAYTPHLENVDVYDFLIDPAAGGIDIERANYLGRYNIKKSKKELLEGVRKKNYISSEVKELIAGASNADTKIVEDTQKTNRAYGVGNTEANVEIADSEVFKFWEWFTTYEGTRYYLLLSPEGKRAIACDPWKERDESELWPFWTWACFLDLTEFWSPSYAEYVAELMMGESVAINQMFDNNEQRNKPQKLVNINAVKNLAELKYRKNSYIKVEGDIDVNKAVQMLEVPAIDTPIKVYEILSGIRDRSSGVTPGTQGVADDKGKATIYEGNQANAADRFGLLNKSYSFGYNRFATLYENGVRQHLTKEIAVEIMGPNGVDIKSIDKTDIFEVADEKFGIIVESSAAETALSELEKKQKQSFLMSLKDNPKVNQEKLIELEAKVAGYDVDTIQSLLMTDEFGTEEILSEADRDIEMILQGDNPKPNAAANNAYKQRFVDYLKDNQENIDMKQFTKLTDYLMRVSQIIDRNMVSALSAAKVNMVKQQMANPQMQQSQNTERPAAPVSPREETLNNITQI